MALAFGFYDFRTLSFPVHHSRDYQRAVKGHSLDESCCAELCASIVELAVKDLEMLRSTDVDHIGLDISYQEITDFFNSDFFEMIIGFITQGTYSGANARRALGIDSND